MNLDAILELGREAAAAGEFEAAYHLLMAAVHLADHRRDTAALERLTRLAREQGALVEAVSPPHRLSRSYAAARGHTALFDTLMTHIKSVELRLEAERQRRQHHYP